MASDCQQQVIPFPTQWFVISSRSSQVKQSSSSTCDIYCLVHPCLKLCTTLPFPFSQNSLEQALRLPGVIIWLISTCAKRSMSLSLDERLVAFVALSLLTTLTTTFQEEFNAQFDKKTVVTQGLSVSNGYPTHPAVQLNSMPSALSL